MKELKNLLEKIGVDIARIEEKERKEGKKFNIFSILGMERREVQTHSMLIYELINPKGSHAQGDKYLDLFLIHVLGINEKNAFTAVEREFQICIEKDTEEKDQNRRIDFVIETSKHLIAIEMKIDAGDQPQQLVDYFKYIKAQAEQKGKEPTLYYLTLDGREASDDSCMDKVKNEKVPYTSISFRDNIKEWIDACITEASEELSFIHESLRQYKNLILKITGQSEEEIKMEIAKIINTPDTVKVATEIAKNINFIWAKKEAEFWQKLAEQLKIKIADSDIQILFSSRKKGDFLLETKNDNLATIIAEDRMSVKEADIGILFQKGNEKLYLTIMNGYEPCYSIHKTDTSLLQKFEITGGEYLDYKYNASKYYFIFYANGVVEPSCDLFEPEKLTFYVTNIANEAYADYLSKWLEK